MSKKTRELVEAALFLAMALALSYLKIPLGLSFGGFGGSIDFVMVPLIILAMRQGPVKGVAVGLAFGILKYFLASGFAISWESILLDYSVAYAAVGVAGFFRAKKYAPLSALAGCCARFAVHFISGVTVYAKYMPEVFLGMPMKSATIYSVLYNGTYMLPNTVLAIIAVTVLANAIPNLIQQK